MTVAVACKRRINIVAFDDDKKKTQGRKLKVSGTEKRELRESGLVVGGETTYSETPHSLSLTSHDMIPFFFVLLALVSAVVLPDMICSLFYPI